MGKRVDYIQRLKDSNFEFNKSFKVVEKVEKNCVITETKYGMCKNDLKYLYKGHVPTITSALNKESYLQKEIEDVNAKLSSKIKVLKYNNYNSVVVQCKHGICEVSVKVLKNSNELPLLSAVDKTKFWVSRCKELRKDFEKIDYSEVIWINNSNKVKLKCKDHNNTYYQRPSHHTAGTQGCVHCMSQVIKYTDDNIKNNSEFFDSLQGLLYVIRLYNEEENFYKVGITQPKRFKYRMNSLKNTYGV